MIHIHCFYALTFYLSYPLLHKPTPPAPKFWEALILTPQIFLRRFAPTTLKRTWYGFMWSETTCNRLGSGRNYCCREKNTATIKNHSSVFFIFHTFYPSYRSCTNRHSRHPSPPLQKIQTGEDVGGRPPRKCGKRFGGTLWGMCAQSRRTLGKRYFLTTP